MTGCDVGAVLDGKAVALQPSEGGILDHGFCELADSHSKRLNKQPIVLIGIMCANTVAEGIAFK